MASSVTQLPYYGANMFMGQRFYTGVNDAFNPVAVGPVLSGVPSVIPTVYPPNSPATVSPAGGPVSPTNSAQIQAAGNSPFSFIQSPVVLLIAFLVVSLLVLRYIHFKS